MWTRLFFMCVPKNLLKILIFEKDLPPLILVFRKILYDSLFEKYISGKSSLDQKLGYLLWWPGMKMYIYKH